MKVGSMLLFGVAIAIVAGCANTTSDAPVAPKDILAGTITGLKVETLRTSRLELAEGVEVVMSRVSIPANTTLPKHYHPGEEFIYVLTGSGTLWLKGKEDTALKAGDTFKVPLKAVHTFKSGPNGAQALVCRVHESGKPMRYNVDDDK